MTSKTVKKSKGLSLEDLMGLTLVPVERISTQIGKNKTLIIVGKVHDEESDNYGITSKWGIVTEEAVEKLLSSGKIEDDKVILYLPEPNVDESINWVKFLPEVEA